MKGIILAGGNATRLYPMTLSITKQILPVYDKPMIYYPLATLMLGGVREILIITTPRDLLSLENLLGDGHQWGLKFSYAVQPRPEGLAQAFIIGADFIGKNSVVMVLGDNIFYGHRMSEMLSRVFKSSEGSTVFAHRVHDPARYGVIELNEEGQPLSIVEKPTMPKSNLAVVGLYVYDNMVLEIVKNLKPSSRGELEITDINAFYLKHKKLKVEILGRGFAWFDTGTPDSLLDAANYIATIEKRQGLKIASPDEIAFRKGHITKSQLEKIIADHYEKNEYGNYLRSILNET